MKKSNRQEIVIDGHGKIHYQADLDLLGKPSGKAFATIAHALGEEDVNILVFSIAETNGFGVVRALVNKSEKAHDKLVSLGFNIAFTEVIPVRMIDQLGDLYDLGDAGINIEYSYAYSGKEGAALILRVDQIHDAIERMLKSGATLLEKSVFR